MNHLLKLNANHNAAGLYFRLAVISLEQGDLVGAEKYAKAALALEYDAIVGERYLNSVLMAEIRMAQADFTLARSWLEKALALGKNMPGLEQIHEQLEALRGREE